MQKVINCIARLVILMFAISVMNGSIQAQEMSTELVSQSEKYFKKFAKKINNRSVVVGLYYQGKDTILTFGRINLLGRKVDENDLFQIGSVSKTFTGLMLADAVVKGSFNLNDNLSDYLEIKKASKYERTTLLQLATHTSGMAGNTVTLHALPMASYLTLSLSKKFLLEAISAPAAFIDLPWQLAVIPPPVPYFSTYGKGSVDFDLNLYGINEKKVGTMKYSNLGMGVLGRVLAQPYGNSYEKALYEVICEPLKMDATSTDPSKVLKKNYATPHNLLGFRVFRTKFKHGGIEGAGGIKSTGADMMKYLRLQMDSTYHPQLWQAVKLQQETYFVSEDPQSKGLEMGLSWIKYNPNNDPSSAIIWHNGQVSGTSAFIGFNSKRQLGLFVLSNNPRAKRLAKDSFRILNYMLQTQSDEQ